MSYVMHLDRGLLCVHGSSFLTAFSVPTASQRALPPDHIKEFFTTSVFDALYRSRFT